MTQYPAAPQQVPPGYTGYASPPKKPVWPTAIGVISIIIGGLLSLCACAIIPFNMINRANPAVQEMMEQFPEWWGTWQIVGGLVLFGLNVLLLVAGICLVRHRPSALPLHVTFGIFGLIYCAVNTIATFAGMADVELPGPMGDSMKPFMLIGMMLGPLFIGAYPIFVLIWFSRPSIRQEVRSWAAPVDAQTPYQG